jgi:hypothetical protein
MFLLCSGRIKDSCFITTSLCMGDRGINSLRKVCVMGNMVLLCYVCLDHKPVPPSLCMTYPGVFRMNNTTGAINETGIFYPSRAQEKHELLALPGHLPSPAILPITQTFLRLFMPLSPIHKDVVSKVCLQNNVQFKYFS